MNTSARLLLVSIFLITTVAGIYYRPDTRSLCRNLSCIRMIGTDGYRLKETYIDTKDVYRALYTSGENYLRIEAASVPDSKSKAALNEEVTRMKGMFDKAPAPYPGEISDAIVCDPQFQPVFTELDHSGTPISMFAGYMNQRMTFGSCSQSQAAYRGYLTFFYCQRQHALIRMELIVKPDRYETIKQFIDNQLDSINCPA